MITIYIHGIFSNADYENFSDFEKKYKDKPETMAAVYKALEIANAEIHYDGPTSPKDDKLFRKVFIQHLLEDGYLNDHVFIDTHKVNFCGKEIIYKLVDDFRVSKNVLDMYDEGFLEWKKNNGLT